MTEYDFSPEAVDAYLRKQQQIARWVDKTNSKPCRDPYTPATPAAPIDRALGDDTPHRRRTSDRHDRPRDPARSWSRDRDRERSRDRPRDLSRDVPPDRRSSKPHSKRHRSASHSVPVVTRPTPSVRIPSHHRYPFRHTPSIRQPGPLATRTHRSSPPRATRGIRPARPSRLAILKCPRPPPTYLHLNNSLIPPPCMASCGPRCAHRPPPTRTMPSTRRHHPPRRRTSTGATPRATRTCRLRTSSLTGPYVCRLSHPKKILTTPRRPPRSTRTQCTSRTSRRRSSNASSSLSPAGTSRRGRAPRRKRKQQLLSRHPAPPRRWAMRCWFFISYSWTQRRGRYL